MTIISKLKQLPIKDRYKITKSPKGFVILDKNNNYILTNDLDRYRNIYINDGGFFGCIQSIKNEL